MVCDRWDTEFFATGKWKATPCRVLILMTLRRGICRFSANSNYKHGGTQSICLCVMPAHKTKDPSSGLSAEGAGVSFCRSFPSMERKAVISPAPDPSHHVLFPQCPAQEFQYSPVRDPLPLLPTAFLGRLALFGASK